MFPKHNKTIIGLAGVISLLICQSAFSMKRKLSPREQFAIEMAQKGQMPKIKGGWEEKLIREADEAGVFKTNEVVKKWVASLPAPKVAAPAQAVQQTQIDPQQQKKQEELLNKNQELQKKLDQTIQEAVTAQEKLKLDIANLNKQLQTAKSATAAEKNETANLKLVLEQSEKELNISQQNLQKITQEKELLDQQVKNLSSQQPDAEKILALNKINQQLEENIKTMEKGKNELEKSVKKLQETLKNVKTQAQKISEEVSELKTKTKTLKEEMQKANQKAQEEIDKAQKDIANRLKKQPTKAPSRAQSPTKQPSRPASPTRAKTPAKPTTTAQTPEQWAAEKATGKTDEEKLMNGFAALFDLLQNKQVATECYKNDDIDDALFNIEDAKTNLPDKGNALGWTTLKVSLTQKTATSQDGKKANALANILKNLVIQLGKI